MLLSTLKNRKAFSMLELVFVISVLGIVASIGSQIIVQVYESYISQKAIHNSSIKTELAATQLVNRLAYSIPGTVIGRKDAAVFNAIENIPIGTTDRVILEWIGEDADSFGAIASMVSSGFARSPVWSGYADVAASSINTLSTPGSRLTALDGIISNLSASGIANAAILFPSTYNAHTLGYQETPAGTIDGIHPISGQGGNTSLTLDAKANRTIKEHYKLAWTAYAVVPSVLTAAQLADRGLPAGDLVYDLILYYDYQPWDGENYTNGSSQTLIRNVSVFKFTGTGETIRFKICQRESVGGAFTINSCKEKAVIR